MIPLGKSGTTDVIIDSPLGHDRYRAIVEVKASSAGRVPEGQINWPAIDSHRQRANADHAVVVGERFGGGNLRSFADQFGIALLDTEALTEVLRLHAATPFPAPDLRPLVATPGLLTAVVADLRQKSRAVDRHWQVIAEIIRIVDDFAHAESPPTPTSSSLYAVLFHSAMARRGEGFSPPSEQDVRDSVSFLSSRAVGILRPVEPETAGYRPTMTRPIVLQRLRALAAAIRGQVPDRGAPEQADHGRDRSS